MTFPGDRPIVCLITSGESTPANFSQTSIKILDLISVAVLNRISLIQIREKQLDGKQLLELVSKAVSLTTGSMTKLLVNGRTDVAIAAGADGVHLPSDAYSPAAVRTMVGANFLIGVSTHRSGDTLVPIAGSSGETAFVLRTHGDKSVPAPADYVVFGPVFDTPGKTGTGVESLKQVVKSFPDIPILGLGGIGETNVCDVLETGAAGFAAIRYLNEKDNLGRLDKVIKGCKGND